MVKSRRFWLLTSVAVGAALAASARWSVLAQERGGRRAPEKAEAPAAVSVSDALLRPLDLPFGEEASLEDVRKFLARTLKAPVVLDLAALDRLELTPEDKVMLDLKGVRLKVGLKLLLDQVGLSFRVVAEDNLLILTDPAESGDPTERALAEIKELHRDLHDMRDAVDDLRDLVEEDLGIEPEPEQDRKRGIRVGSKRPGRRRPVLDRKRADGVRG